MRQETSETERSVNGSVWALSMIINNFLLSACWCHQTIATIKIVLLVLTQGAATTSRLAEPTVML